MNQKNLKLLIQSIPILLIWLLSYSLLQWIVKHYEPSLESLKIVSKTVTGRFEYRDGGAGTQPYTQIGNVLLTCHLNAFGGTSTCDPGYNSYNVTAELAKVDYLFGSHYVVIKISGLNLKPLIQPPELILERWHKYSQQNAIWYSIMLTIILGLAYVYLVYGEEAMAFDK